MAVSIADPLWQAEFSHFPESAPHRQLRARLLKEGRLTAARSSVAEALIEEDAASRIPRILTSDRTAVALHKPSRQFHSSQKNRRRRTALTGHAALRPREAPAVWHCSVLLVQTPDAQAKLEPHDVPTASSAALPLRSKTNSPSLTNASTGQIAESPGQTSAVSDRKSVV